MAKINFKTYVLNCIRPIAHALRQKIDQNEDLLVDRVAKQDEAVRQTQELFAKQMEEVLTIKANMIDFKSTVDQLRNTIATSDDVAALKKRVKELNYLYSVFYDIVYDIKNKGTTDKVLPDETKPFISNAELLRLYKIIQGLDEDVELTEEQKKEFEFYKKLYFQEHPNQKLEEEL